jgi:hypothetical protein
VHDMFLANTSDIDLICRTEDHFCIVDARDALISADLWPLLTEGWKFRLSRGPHKSTCHAVVESF